MRQIFFHMPNELVKTNDGIFMPRRNEEKVISYPDEHDFFVSIEENSFWFRHRNRCLAAVTNKFTPKQTLFDIGGGNGFVAKGLINAGMNVVLVEPGIKGAKNAVNRGVTNVICATLQESGFDPESIPNVGLFDVLEHIENDEEFLIYINSMMSNDGHIYITVPAYTFLWSSEDDDAGHFRRYTLKSLTRVLRKSGFEITFKSYLFSFLPLPIFLFRTIPSKLGIMKKHHDATIKEHNPAFSRLVNGVLSIERKLLLQGLIRFGGSCLVVARKGATQ